MISVVVLIGIGLGLIAGGFYYHLYDDILIDFFSAYVLDTSDIYYVGSQFIWDAIPYLLILVGFLMFVIAGLQVRHGTPGGT